MKINTRLIAEELGTVENKTADLPHTAKDLMASDINTGNITRVYAGKDNVCRCGCKGKYYEDPKIIKRAINKVKKLEASGEITDQDFGGTYLNISYGNDRALCFYFD